MQSAEIKLDLKGIKEYVEQNLSEKRRIHTYAVRDEAIKLASLYGEDVAKAEIAALFHDICRGTPMEVLNEYVLNLGLATDLLDNGNLSHGKIAAMIMEKDFNISDRDIINAVSYHTTGRKDMSLLEKIIYIADAIEPNRSYPDVDKIRELAYKDLDAACLKAMENIIKFIIDKDLYLDENTVSARDSLAKKKGIGLYYE